jgi:hypothetical protein
MVTGEDDRDETDAGPTDGWSHLTEEERARLREKYAAAAKRHAEGRSVPMDAVLPRYRQAG